MHSVGPESTTANAEAGDKQSDTVKSSEQNVQHKEDPQSDGQVELHPVITTNATNVIPTSPQYGVAIIPNPTVNDTPLESITPSAEIIMDPTAKVVDENKDLQATPSRNDRFKVVKIASSEPFKRGRWKCMDYVDETPPPTTQASKTPQSGNIYVWGTQPQSLPQQQIQQMLMQRNFTAAPIFPGQLIPHTQYFYAPSNIPGQNLPQQLINATSGNMPQQFISTTQPYFPGLVPNSAGFTMPQNFQNLQYVSPNVLQNQTSAFVPTSQNITQLQQNFQQSQTYAGQPTVSQQNVAQPLVNGHAFPQNEQSNAGNSLPAQTAKSVILNSNQPTLVQSQTQTPASMPNNTQSQSQSVPVQTQQYTQLQAGVYPQQNLMQQTPQAGNVNPIQQMHLVANVSQSIPQSSPAVLQATTVTQNVDQSLPSSVYTNPQFVASCSVSSLPILEGAESAQNVAEGGGSAETTENTEDPAKTNPVVNAIDNKIEQAMDLVKSHLMYTVREEVEVLKEKIAELMEKIQQLETENNFLKSQIPKNQNANANATSSTPDTLPQ